MELNYKPCKRVLPGMLTTDETVVTQSELPSMTTSRSRHVAFKIQNSAYVAGGYDESREAFILREI